MFPQFTAHTYGLFHALALVVLLINLFQYLPVAMRAGPTDFRLVEKRTSRHVLWLTVLYVLCNFVVAKVLFDLRNDSLPLDWHNYLRLEHYRGGFWGWPIVFLPLALVYPFVFRLPRMLTLRAISLALPPVLILQKAACFCAGCCTGVQTDMPWGTVFPANSLCPTPGVPVHPVPIYDVLFAAGMWVVVGLMDRYAAARPFLFPVVVGLYGLNRLVTEFFRPEYDGTLSLRQALAAGTAAAAVVLLLIGRKAWRALLGDGDPSQDTQAAPDA